MEPDRDRLIFLFGEDALPDLDDYDLRNEGDVIEAVERFLPPPNSRALPGIAPSLRVVPVNQILNDDPPETWQTVERLRAGGYNRDDILRQLTIVNAEILMDALETGERVDPARLVNALNELPLPTSDRVAEILVEVARAEPGLTATQHVERTLAALGPGTGTRVREGIVDRVLEHLVGRALEWLADDVTVVFHDTIAGRVFTHRITDAELELGLLSVSVDLAAFGRFDTVRLADGSELEQVSAEPGHLAWGGPPGWLDDFRSGDLLAVTAAFDPPSGDEPTDATIHVRVLADAPTMTDALGAAVRAAYDREQHEHGLPVSTEDLVLSLCHFNRELFTQPMPPLSEWIDRGGLDRNGNLVAHDDAVWRQDLLRRRIHRVFDLVPDEEWRRVLGRAVDTLADPDASVDEVRACLAECAEPETLDVLADVLIPALLEPEDEFVRDRADSPGYVFELVQRATAVASRSREIATAEYLACILHERCAQPLIAADHLARAVDAQPRLGPIVERLGWYCFDRGDARGAMRWWRELRDPHPGADTIAPLLAPLPGRRKLGRNDPCWCGSGRKFKQCHQGVNELPALPDRVGWLRHKAAMWLEHASSDTRQLVSDLALAYLAGDPDADASDVLDDRWDDVGDALDDPIIVDVALHEGGQFKRFLRERGDLLPDDERLLGAAWLTVDRSLHEVVSVDRGVGMTLRDLATGEVVEVRERTASQGAQVGERVCARVVPDGAGHQINGAAFPVRTGHEEIVLELCAAGDPRELCAWAGARARPPRIVRTPGLIDGMLDRDAIEAALADLGDDADQATVMARLTEEIGRQAQAKWLDEHVPALGGLTPREAAADPTRREQLERLLAEFDQQNARLRDASRADLGGGPITYDTAELRRELGLG